MAGVTRATVAVAAEMPSQRIKREVPAGTVAVVEMEATREAPAAGAAHRVRILRPMARAAAAEWVCLVPAQTAKAGATLVLAMAAAAVPAGKTVLPASHTVLPATVASSAVPTAAEAEAVAPAGAEATAGPA